MIALHIDGAEVHPQADAAISFVDSNPMLDASESKGSYSYDISLDLNDAANAIVLRHVHRINSSYVADDLPAELYCDGRCIFRGVATVLQVDGHIAKVQVLCGNSENNFFANETRLATMDLGTLPEYTAQTALATLTAGYPATPAVCTPVMKTLDIFPQYTADADKCVNLLTNDLWAESRQYVDGQTFIGQPYLLYVVERVFAELGWSIGSNCLRTMEYAKRMVVIHAHNTREVAKMIPNWTVSEFLQEVQKLFNVMIICDDLQKTVSIYNVADFYASTASEVSIDYERIVTDDEYPGKNFAEKHEYAFNYDGVEYELPSVTWYNRAALSEDVRKLVTVLDFSSFSAFNTDTYRSAEYYNKPYLFHETNSDTYWVLVKKTVSTAIPYHFERADFFRPAGSDSDRTSFKILPAEVYCMDMRPEYTDGNNKLIGAAIPFARNADVESTEDEPTETNGLNEWIDGAVPKDVDTSNDKMFVAQYLGFFAGIWTHSGTSPGYADATYPQCAVTRYLSGFTYASNLRYNNLFDIFYTDDDLGESIAMDLVSRKEDVYSVDGHVNTRQTFTVYYYSADRLPVNAIYLINNRRFVCLRNEYSIENGNLSHLVKGTFLPYD